MTYYLFLDESGDHGLTHIDQTFPMFVLCGVLFSGPDYLKLVADISVLKNEFWAGKKVILHSSDIRKCNKEFQILFDLNLKANFYTKLNEILANSKYVVIASCINKPAHIIKYGRLAGDVYEIALSFVIERAIFYLDDVVINTNINLKVIIEKRGKKEDRQLAAHFQKLMVHGTGYVNAQRLKSYNIDIDFRDKTADIAGLQIADLIAYPIARYCMDKKRANPAFDIIDPKFYRKKGNRYGLKIFP